MNENTDFKTFVTKHKDEINSLNRYQFLDDYLAELNIYKKLKRY